MINSISVFCGSSSGANPAFSEKAYQLGKALAKKNIRVVYGGAKIGLMGSVAKGALDSGGEVFGVIPSFLQSKEVAHESLTELIVVETMHERKTKMHELSDGIITLPGGFGTMEEFFEILTWSQLGLHSHPIGLLNIDGYYNMLIDQLDVMLKNELLKPVNRRMVLVSDQIDDLLKKMEGYSPPDIQKWITPDKT